MTTPVFLNQDHGVEADPPLQPDDDSLQQPVVSAVDKNFVNPLEMQSLSLNAAVVP